MKFFLGVRFLITSHVATHAVPKRKLLLLNSAAIAVWLAIVVTLGWLAGRISRDIIPAYHWFTRGLLLLVLLMLAVQGAKHAMRRWLIVTVNPRQ